MSTAVRSNYFRETMPQTVPSAGYDSPYCDYSAFTTDFDLSLLPESPESEVPLSPTNNLSPYSYLCPSSPPMFSTNLEDGILCDSIGFVNVKAKITAGPEVKTEFDDEPLHTPLKKTPSAGFFGEKIPDFKSENEKFEFYKSEEKPLIPTTIQATVGDFYSPAIKQEPSLGVEYCHSPELQTPSSSPASTVTTTLLSSASSSPSSLSPVSTPSSPPTFAPSLSTSFAIKTERAIDLKEAIAESSFLKSSDGEQYTTLRGLLKSSFSDGTEPSSRNSSISPSSTSSSDVSPPSSDAKIDHQLLRSVLRDTSFQKKFNIKPFDLPKTESYDLTPKDIKMEEDNVGDKPKESGDIVEGLTSEKIEPVFSLAIEQIRKDVDNTCNVLGISNDPTQWAEEDVKAWLLWTVRQFSLPLIDPDRFKMDGAAFCQLTEDDFQQRAPQSSSTLHAHLEIWKAAANCGECSTTPSQDLNAIQWSPTMHSSGSSTGGDLSEDDDEEMDCSTYSPQSKPGTSQSKEPSTSVGKGKSGSGTHIHLWQFLKELLASPQAHGSCIRWLDRQKGVFKIEDSVRVARLWGKRKNRPAMNYDKLSRSIRQYYKKGIMKKTERSQRLVYQFCHPYSL